MAKDNQPIIIKKKKSGGGDGHHGGAWKVAYADFVTAMMAFFLLMWLLNATTESQRKGIADYFAPTIPISPITGGGSGILSGDSVFAEDTLAQDGTGGTKQVASTLKQKPGDAGQVEGEQSSLNEPERSLEEVESQFVSMSGESDVADDLLSHIRTEVTDEGLVIEIFAKEGQPLFQTGSEEPSRKMRLLLAMVGDVIGLVSNRIAITGHTDAIPFTGADFDNWRLSSARADRSRRSLIGNGIDEGRFDRITGKADQEPALPDAPEDPRNRRITLTLLRSDK
ncbi:MAG: flagellar motor protein MotB [Pseudomonadota bacterium]